VQLKARNFFVKVPHPDLNDELPYCGPYITMSETPITLRNRAPLIGEHNLEIYVKDLGLKESDLKDLKAKGVI